MKTKRKDLKNLMKKLKSGKLEKFPVSIDEDENSKVKVPEVYENLSKDM